MDQAAEHAEQLARLKADIEDAFDRAKHGEATDADWSLMAWQLGIREHYKRSTQQEFDYAEYFANGEQQVSQASGRA